MAKEGHSYTFTLSGRSSDLKCYFNPPIYLGSESEFEMALLNFESFNSIPNVDENNNILKYEEYPGKWDEIIFPVGVYDIDDIANYVNRYLEEKQSNNRILIRGNNNTQRVSIKTTCNIDFDIQNSICSLLGFKQMKLNKNKSYMSDHIVNINKVNAIQIYCNLVSGSYNNGEPVHVLYHFFPKVPAGFKIIESPQQPIYLPVSGSMISFIEVRILDQSGEQVNFREEEITVSLHLRKL